jgi:hypothetical protein
MLALMIDIGLNNSGTRKSLRPTYGSGGYFSNRGPVPVTSFATDKAGSSTVTETLEGRRTFLGCFVLTSV